MSCEVIVAIQVLVLFLESRKHQNQVLHRFWAAAWRRAGALSIEVEVFGRCTE